VCLFCVVIMAHSVRSFISIASAICIWLAAILQGLQYFGATGGPDLDLGQNGRSQMRALDPPTLRKYWEYRRSQFGVDFMIDLLGALGLAGLAWSSLVLKRVFKRYKNGQSDLPGFMTGCFFIGAILPSTQFLQTMGYSTAANLMSAAPELPDSGIQALHVAYNISRGGIFYLVSVQFIFVSAGLIIASVLTYNTAQLSRKHAGLGFATAFMGIMTFIFEIISFNAREIGTGITLGVFVLLYGIILLPIWLVWLGAQLRHLKHDEVLHGQQGHAHLKEENDSVPMDSIAAKE